MENLINNYLNNEDKEEFMSIINPIYNHPEFIRRDSSEFYHHSDITLSTHILEVALLTYIKGKRIKKKDKTFNLKVSVLIAMMHDLYCEPWQNNNTKTKYFSNKHGFRHPMEAVINSITWFSCCFKNEEEAKIIIDGILHHMYPLGVRVYSKNMELKNEKYLKRINKKYIKMIKNSTNRLKVLNLSFAKSKYKEGRLVSICDKKVSFGQIKNLSSLTSLLTGRNRSIN